MERYNYNEAMRENIRAYIEENYTREEIAEELLDRSDWEDELNERLWTEDSVTGNASGSYTFSSWEAEENLCHNMGLLEDALREFGSEGADILERGAEWCGSICLKTDKEYGGYRTQYYLKDKRHKSTSVGTYGDKLGKAMAI